MSPACKLMMSLDQFAQRHLQRLAISKDSCGHVDHGFEFGRGRVSAASCTKRKVALSTTMHAITVPARASPVAKEIDERAASRITSGLRRMIKSRMNQPRRRSCATSFGPAVRALARHPLASGLRSRVQRLKQCIGVLPRRIEDGRGNADVVVLGLWNRGRLVRSRRCSAQPTPRVAFLGWFF